MNEKMIILPYIVDIYDVVTRSEAAILWGVAHTTVDMAINRGQLIARTSIGGGAVLVSARSMQDVFGNVRESKISLDFKQAKDDQMNLPPYQRYWR